MRERPVTPPSTATATTVLDGLDAVRAAVGTSLGTSEWLRVDQDRLDRFAAATGDDTCAYLALSLTNGLLPAVVDVRGVAMGLNYGTNRVRFPAAVPAGSRVRVHAQLTDVTDVPGGVQTTMTVTVEIEGGDQPACVVEVLSRFLE